MHKAPHQLILDRKREGERRVLRRLLLE